MEEPTPIIIALGIPFLLLVWALIVHLCYDGKHWLWPTATQDFHDDDIHQEIQDRYITKLKLNSPTGNKVPSETLPKEEI